MWTAAVVGDDVDKTSDSKKNRYFGKENKGHTVKAELISNAEKAISRECRKLQLCGRRQKNGH